MDYYILGNNIRMTRKSLKMTQEKVAELIDVSTVFISQLENGSRKPSLETIYKLSIAFGVSLDDLVKNVSKNELTTDISEINVLLENRTKTEIKFATAIVREIMARLNDNKIV